ncbi:MAG: vWA domain-containing protein, partial [Comamonas sp.]
TELQGQPVAFKDLSAQEQQKLLQVVRQRLDAVQQLSNKLAASGQAQEAQALQSLLGQPDTANLWSVHGEPLITAWGQAAAPAEVAQPEVVPPVVPPAPVALDTDRKRRPWWLWLLPLLLLLLLLLLGLWYLFSIGKLAWPERAAPTVQVKEAEDAPFQCRKNGVPPDFVMIVDTSGSMDVNINVSEKDEQWFFYGNRTRLDNVLQADRIAKIHSEPKRMTIAKQALSQVVENMHPAITTNVLTFGKCGQIFHHGAYNSAQRGSLANIVRSLPADGATPIAHSLRHAAKLVDGKDKDAVVLLFVDGEDGCGEDVCQVSSALHQQKPKLRINVVNISDKPMSNCVAENTGGRVYAAKDANTLVQHLTAAANEVMNKEDCSVK